MVVVAALPATAAMVAAVVVDVVVVVVIVDCQGGQLYVCVAVEIRLQWGERVNMIVSDRRQVQNDDIVTQY